MEVCVGKDGLSFCSIEFLTKKYLNIHVNILSMAVKTLTITEDAYGALVRLKGMNESFSQLFMRLAGQKMRVSDLCGRLSKESCDSMKENIMKLREKSNKDMEARISDVRARYKRCN